MDNHVSRLPCIRKNPGIPVNQVVIRRTGKHHFADMLRHNPQSLRGRIVAKNPDKLFNQMLWMCSVGIIYEFESGRWKYE